MVGAFFTTLLALATTPSIANNNPFLDFSQFSPPYSVEQFIYVTYVWIPDLYAHTCDCFHVYMVMYASFLYMQTIILMIFELKSFVQENCGFETILLEMLLK